MSNRVRKASRRIRRTRWFVYRLASRQFLGDVTAADLFEAERLAARKWGGDGFRIVYDC
jgi:hypothetical protein